MRPTRAQLSYKGRIAGVVVLATALLGFGLAAASACPPKPNPKVDTTAFDDRTCESDKVATTTTTTTTDWVLKDDTWVPATPVVTRSVTTRPATLLECPTKPAPEIVVVPSEATNCDSNTITTTTVTTTTDWVLVNNSWIKDIPTGTQSVVIRPKTTAEAAACSVVPPVVPPAEQPTPVVSDETTVVSSAEVALPAAVSAANAVNPLPVGAAAGQADTSGQPVLAGFAGSAGLLMLGAGSFLRRRSGGEA